MRVQRDTKNRPSKKQSNKVASASEASKVFLTDYDAYFLSNVADMIYAKDDLSGRTSFTFDKASIEYDKPSDRIILTVYKKRLAQNITVERNSHYDRIFRKLLLAEKLITSEESQAYRTRKIMPKFLSSADMPYPVYGDEFTLGKGEGDKEIVWESSVYPHMIIFGREGSGKTNLTRNLLTYASHKSMTWSSFVEIDLSIEEAKPKSNYRIVSRGCKTTIDDALEACELFHRRMKALYFSNDSGEYSAHEFLIIEHLELLMPNRWVKNPESLDSDYDKKVRFLALLNDILEYGNVVKNMHFVATTNEREVIRYHLKYKESEAVCKVALGHIGPEDSHYLFDDNGGYFVSPYVKGRGYIRFGNEVGQEFQSYFIEEDYLNSLAYEHQLYLGK